MGSMGSNYAYPPDKPQTTPPTKTLDDWDSEKFKGEIADLVLSLQENQGTERKAVLEMIDNMLAEHQTKLIQQLIDEAKTYRELVDVKDDYWISEKAVPVEKLKKLLKGLK